MTSNWFSTLAIVSWPLVAIYLYNFHTVTRATIWTVMGAQLLLPANVGIKFEMIPQIDRSSIAGVCVLVGCLVTGSRLWHGRWSLGWPECLIAAYLICPFITAQLNGDPIPLATQVLPGVGFYDAFSNFESQFLIFVPFLLGRSCLDGPDDQEEILRSLVLAGLAYSILVLFEIRMSPQLSNWIYGYFPSSFSSERRFGGFRPVVFFQNGLALAFFMMTTGLAATAFWRTRTQVVRLSPGVVASYLLLVVVFCKSVGSLVYAVVLAPVIRLFSAKVQMRVALVLVTISLLYPLLRATDVFPGDAIVEFANHFDEERGGSLNLRFNQEQQLLAHASERPLFGWGRYGRNRLYNEETGENQSITDGFWILTIGQYGLFGFLAVFGLLCLPVFRAAAAYRFAATDREQLFMASVALILAISVVEQLPNASLSPWTWLVAGALLGRTERLKSLSRA